MSGLDRDAEGSSAWQRPLAYVRHAPTRAFAAGPDAPRARRPTDVTLLIVTVSVLALDALDATSPPGPMQQAVADLLRSVQGVMEPLWKVMHDLLLLWVGLVVVLALVRRQWSLLRDLATGVVVVVVGAGLVGRAATGSWPHLLDSLLQRSSPVPYPSVGLALAVSLAAIAAPHLTRPFRYAGRWLVAAGVLSSAALGIVEVGHVLGAVTLAWASAAAVHLVFGSPGGLPSLHRVREGLAGMGVDAEPLEMVSKGGVVRVRARRADGADLDVKVYGRDAWDGQLLVSLWRFVWYRDAGPTLSLSRIQQVEHEAFITLLAERSGVPVDSVLAAGLDIGGDALLVTERFGTSVDDRGLDLTDSQLDAAWSTLAVLHRAGISHGGLEFACIRVHGDEVRLADFALAEVAPTGNEQFVDRAQLLMVTSALAGTGRAVAAAQRALGLQGLADVSSFVQPAALPRAMRRSNDDRSVVVDDVRAAVAAATETPLPDLQRLRRLSWGRVFMFALFAVASWMLISSIAEIGLDTIADAMRDASKPLLVLAFLVGLTPRFANAIALEAAAPTRVPLGRLTALQFAITFINLAMPSTAARVAVNIRFFQRSGAPGPAAVTVGVLDSVFGFVGQILLIVSIIALGIGSLDLQVDLSQPTVQKLIVWVAIALVVAVAIVLCVRSLRQKVIHGARRTWELVRPLLTSPRRAAVLLAANMVAELLFSLCMYTTLRAFGQDVGFFDVVLVNEFVALFAGLMPVPGGVGVTEAALTAGFIAIGVDESTAFAAAITQRIVTYYTQPIIGWFAFRWLQREKYL